MVGIPVGLSIGAYIFIKRRKYKKGYRLIALIPILLASYFIYVAVYPSEEFYEEDFTEVTGLTLPNKRKFLFKTATFPDHFGDYTSISIIKIDSNFYDLLLRHLNTKHFNKVQDRAIFGDSTLKKYYDGYVKNSYNTVLSGKEYTVEFLSDYETIIVERVSW